MSSFGRMIKCLIVTLIFAMIAIVLKDPHEIMSLCLYLLVILNFGLIFFTGLEKPKLPAGESACVWALFVLAIVGFGIHCSNYSPHPSLLFAYSIVLVFLSSVLIDLGKKTVKKRPVAEEEPRT